MIPNIVSVVAAIAVGLAMCAAGAAKISMGRRWPMEATALGAPRFIVPVLPWVEVLGGALLVAQCQRRWVAVAVGVMLFAFTMLIVSNLAHGRRPRCACFGSWSTRPLGWGHIVRNAVLLALAVVAAM